MSTPHNDTIDLIRQTTVERYIFLNAVSKSFTSDRHAGNSNNIVLKDLSLTLRRGGLNTVFGPNGSGKTTFLNLLAGLIKPDSGTVTIEGQKPALGVAGYVFQNSRDSLFPWRTVEGNLLFPLEICFASEGERRRRQLLLEFVKTFNFHIPLKSKVYELSGGQQQMVSLARTLITRPSLLLMDEPFSALDFRLRRAMHEQILSYWHESKATILLVSHDIDEAIYLGERLILFPPRPVTSVREMPIPLPYPRSRDVLFTQEFLNVRSNALRFYEEESWGNA